MFNYLRTENGRTMSKILAIMLVITLTFVNFIVLGTYLGKGNISLAADESSTSEENVKFNVYLNAEKTSKEATVDLNAKDLKLYVTVEVNNQGSLENAEISLDSTNFYLKDKKDKTTISLGSIQAGNKIEKVYDIIPKTDEEFNLNWLNMDSTITLKGTYRSGKGTDIVERELKDSTKKVHINYNAPQNIGEEENENHKVNLESNIITNQILSVNGTNKRVLQQMINSNVNNNSYPIKNTNIEVKVPTLGGVKPESVKVATYGTAATNGKYLDFGTKSENKAGSYEYNAEENKLVISVNNNANEDNIVSWEKDTQDLFVITYIYPETATDTKITSEVSNTMILYTYVKDSNKNYVSCTAKKEETFKEVNIFPMLSMGSTEEIYKGNMKIGQDTEFRTSWLIGVSDSNLMDKVYITDGNEALKDTFNEEATINPTTYYKTTYINVDEMKNLLGEDGTITINGKYTVNKDTAKGENQFADYYQVNYTETTSTCTLETSNPVKDGVITIINDKVLKSDENVIAKLDKISSLKSKSAVAYANGENIVGGTDNINFVDSEMKISDTIYGMLAELNKKQISTQASEAETFNFTVTLKQDDIKYTLYKNPVITLELPDYIKSIDLKNEDVELVNSEGKFTIKNVSTSNQKIQIELEGESTSYEADLQILIEAKLKTNTFMPTTEGTIKVGVANNGASEEVASKDIKLTAKTDAKILTASTLKVGENEAETTIKEDKSKTIENGNTNPIEIRYSGKFINNTGSDLSNVSVIGKLDGDLGATVKNIEGSEAITYTSDKEVTKDSTWVSEKPAKATGYKLDFASISNAETKTFSITLELPAGLTTNKLMDLSYSVVSGAVQANSPKITVQTPQNAKLELTVTPLVENNKEVYEGQTLSYEVKVKNIGDGTVKNINVKNTVPEGTTLVETTKNEWTIDSLDAGKEDTRTMKLTVNTLPEGTSSKEIKVKTNVTQEYLVEALTSEITNKIEKAKLFVSLENRKSEEDKDAEVITYENEEIIYITQINNISGEDLNNLEIKVDIPEGTTLVEGKLVKLISEEEEKEFEGVVTGNTIKYSIEKFEAENVEEDEEGKEVIIERPLTVVTKLKANQLGEENEKTVKYGVTIEGEGIKTIKLQRSDKIVKNDLELKQDFVNKTDSTRKNNIYKNDIIEYTSEITNNTNYPEKIIINGKLEGISSIEEIMAGEEKIEIKEVVETEQGEEKAGDDNKDKKIDEVAEGDKKIDEPVEKENIRKCFKYRIRNY